MGKLTPLSSSSSNNSGKTIYTYIVDPNPEENKIIPPEDRFIYVNLRAMTKKRSVIKTDGSFSSIGQSAMDISFIATTEQNGNAYATTNYTNVGNNEGSDESFGIETISVNIKEKQVPEVSIRFVDVRGGALFNATYERENYAGQLELQSKFNAFFVLPYPMFKLEIKGEYGDMVSYCLHLLEFDVSFADNNKFTIDAKFTGFTFAFMNDIPMKYVMGLNSTAFGASAIDKYDVPTIDKYLNGIGKLTSIGQNFKQSNKSFKELTIINTLIEEITEVQNYINKPSSTFRTSLIGNNIGESKLKENKDQLFIRDVGLIATNKLLEHKIIINDVQRFSQEYNTLIENNKSTYQYLEVYKLKDFVIDDPIYTGEIDSTFVAKINSLIDKYESKYTQSARVDPIKSLLNIAISDNKSYMIYNYYKIRQNAEEILIQLVDKKNELENKVNQELNQQVQIQAGVDLSIQNMYKVLLDNSEAFLDTIYAVALEANDTNIQQRRIDSLQGNTTDVPKENQVIYPFPAVFNSDSDEEVWLGDVVGNNNSAFPELRIVDEILNGLVGLNNRFTQQKIQQFANQQITKIKDSNFPLSKKVGKPYLKTYTPTNNNSLPLNFMEDIVGRFFIYDYISKYKQSAIQKISGMEGAFSASNVKNRQFISYLNNINTEEFWDRISSALDNGVDNIYDSVFKSNNFKIEIKKPEQIIKLSENVLDFISSKNIDVKKDILIPGGFYSFGSVNQAYYPEYDVTRNYYLDDTEAQIKKYFEDTRNINLLDENTDIIASSVINDISIYDGQVSVPDYDNRTEDEMIANIENKTFGKINGLSIFDLNAYNNIQNKYLKAYIFLHAFGIQTNNNTLDVKTTGNVIINKIQLLFTAAHFYRINLEKEKGENIFDSISFSFPSISSIINEAAFFSLIINEANDSYFNSSEYNNDDFNSTLSSFFIDWVDNEFEAFEIIVSSYMYKILNGINKNPNSNAYSELKLNIADILEYFRTIYNLELLFWDVKNNYSYGDTHDKVNKSKLETWCKSWFNSFKQYAKVAISIQNRVDNLQEQSQNQIQYITDKDYKLSVYHNIKTIYDKWVAGGLDSKVYNSCSYGRNNDSSISLFERFHFVDRTWSAIGDKAIANPKPLKVLSNLSNINLHNMLHSIADENNFTYFSLPNFVDFKSAEGVKNMFEPKTILNDNSSGASFILMYVGGSSKTLKLNDNQFYVNDGYDFRGDGYEMPKGYTNRRLPVNYEELSQSEKGKYNMVAFRVSIGDQNQSYFRSVRVTQNQFKVTAESINATEEIFSEAGRSNLAYKGQNLYNIFSARAFETSVTMIGNMQIQPLMFFQLDNLAMFTGAYLITSVNHNITPNSVETTFTGLRMPRFSFPIVDSPTTFLNISLNDTLYTKSISSNLFNVIDYDAAFSGDSYESLSGVELSQFTNDGTTLLQNNDTVLQYRWAVENYKSREDEFPFGETIYVLDRNITSVQQLQEKVALNFPQTGNIPAYSADESEECYKWVNDALASIGITKANLKNSAGLYNSSYMNYGDSWVTPAAIPLPLLKFLTPQQFSFAKSKTMNGDLCRELGIPDGSILFGYYVKSNWINRSYDRYLLQFKKAPDSRKQAILSAYLDLDPSMKAKIFTEDGYTTKAGVKEVNNKSNLGEPLQFTVTTHTMLYINGQFLHNVGGTVRRSTDGMRLVCYYPFLSKCYDLINDRANEVGTTSYNPNALVQAVPKLEQNITPITSSTLVIEADGSLKWEGTPNENAIVRYKNNVLKTTLRDKSTRNLSAKEFMDRCWWLLGEGGGNLYKYYAAAIQNRLTLAAGTNIYVGEENTPSQRGRGNIINRNGSYEKPADWIVPVFDGNVDAWNYNKVPATALPNISKAIADAAIGNVIDAKIDGWVGVKEIQIKIAIGNSGLDPNSKIYVKEDDNYYHAFFAFKSRDNGGLPPTTQNIKKLIVKIN